MYNVHPYLCKSFANHTALCTFTYLYLYLYLYIECRPAVAGSSVIAEL